MLFRQIWDDKLAQYAYLIGCQATGEAIVVDPERDIDTYLEIAEKEGLVITAAVDTHIHADYISGLREFAERGVKVYASDEGDADWKYEWLIESSNKGSSYNYQLINHADEFMMGNIKFTVVHSPGHTPEHVAFLVTDMGGGADRPMGLLSGDFVFVGDLGRPDLLESAAGVQGVMEPSARMLYASVQEFLKLDDYIQIWPAHGAGSACGKALGAIPQSTVGYEREFNAAISAAKRGEDVFVETILDGQPEPPMYFARMKRDNKIGPKVLGTLPTPKHLFLEDLKALSGNTDVVVLDTRLDRSAFMARHLPGSLYAGFNKSFNTAAGSIIEENVPIYLIVEEEHLEAAVRDLVRIGLDDIIGYATPATLEAYADHGYKMASIREIHMDDLNDVLAKEKGVTVLDVRNKSEHDPAHVPGSANIAYTRLWLRRDEVPTGTKAVHCVTGGRSAVSAALLSRLGHDVIYINGEFTGWSANPENRVESTTTSHTALQA